MSTIVDYLGRTYDVLALRGPAPEGDMLLDQSLWDGDSGGEICTGIQKLAQWFVTEVLLVRGSIPNDPARGTDLLAGFLSGRFRTETDVYVAFGFAVGDVTATARRVEAADTPADERFGDAVLRSVQLQQGGAVLHVRLISQAGDRRAVILPIPVIL